MHRFAAWPHGEPVAARTQPCTRSVRRPVDWQPRSSAHGPDGGQPRRLDQVSGRTRDRADRRPRCRSRHRGLWACPLLAQGQSPFRGRVRGPFRCSAPAGIKWKRGPPPAQPRRRTDSSTARSKSSLASTCRTTPRQRPTSSAGSPRANRKERSAAASLAQRRPPACQQPQPRRCLTRPRADQSRPAPA